MQFVKVMDYFLLGIICTIHICMYIEHNSVNVFAQETLRIFLLSTRNFTLAKPKLVNSFLSV